MPTIHLDVLTPEKMVFAGDVDMVLAWGPDGQLGILPHHATLTTMLQPGDLVFRQAGREQSLVISSGSLEVRPDRVVVSADACERAEEIDLARAEAAKARAQKALKTATREVDARAAEAALRRSLARIKAVEKIVPKRSGEEMR